MEYTPIRKFYAWVGFATLVTLAIVLVASAVQWFVWAHEVLAASGL